MVGPVTEAAVSQIFSAFANHLSEAGLPHTQRQKTSRRQRAAEPCAARAAPPRAIIVCLIPLS